MISYKKNYHTFYSLQQNDTFRCGHCFRFVVPGELQKACTYCHIDVCDLCCANIFIVDLYGRYMCRNHNEL